MGGATLGIRLNLPAASRGQVITAPIIDKENEVFFCKIGGLLADYEVETAEEVN